MSAVAEQPQTVAVGHAVPAVCAAGLGYSIDDRAILHEVNLEIRSGGFVALLGANGAGKSTLLKVLATLTRASSGTLSLFGQDVGRDASKLRSRIGLIGHQSMLYRDLTARENLEFFGRLYGINEPRQRAAVLLEAVGLAHRAEDPIKAFSRGMVQRLAIARALVHRPELLLADEPFDGLDAPSSRALEGLLGQIAAAGKTIVLVNHDVDQSLRLAQRAVVLRGGRVVMDGPTAEMRAADVLREMEGA